MYKHLIVICFILFLIFPANALSNVTPSNTCKPTFIYVTVTVPPAAQPTPQIIYVPVAATPTQSQTNTSQFTLPSLPKNSEYIIYGALFLSLVVGMVAVMRKKKSKPTQKQKRILEITTDVDELYEETPDPIEQHSQEEDKPKKSKKVKSLLDQDFEF